MKKSFRSRAIDLRKKGWSYNVIASKLGVAKSTLSGWLKEVPYKANETTRRRVRLGSVKSSETRNKNKINSIKSAKQWGKEDVGKLSQRDLMMLGLGLYIGEGSKLYEQVRVINSDPDIIKLAMKWFREVCGAGEDNFSIAVHLYPDTSISEAKKFWSDVTDIKLKQFGKTQIDRRLNKSLKKKRKLPYGTAHITIKSLGNKKLGVELHRKIIGWIEAIYDQARV